MTTVILYFDSIANALKCVADTRLSRNGASISDSGPKILPVPVQTFVQRSQTWRRNGPNSSLGFAYSGSALAALSTHALATACSQNLAQAQKLPDVSVNDIAELFRRAAHHYLIDMSRSIGTMDSPKDILFNGIIFGYCQRNRAFDAYGIEPIITPTSCDVQKTKILLGPKLYTAVGSGAADFVKLHSEYELNKSNYGPFRVLYEMVRAQIRKDVGGSIQLGVATSRGFQLMPLLDDDESVTYSQCKISFLGADVNKLGPVGGRSIGFDAFGIIDPPLRS